MDEEFKVSRKMLKTISADSRANILKALENRPMTASELSRFLGKHVTTVSEHLNLLKTFNLIERIERPGRKWIYYKLTREGKKVLHPESYRWVAIIAVTFLVLGASWFVFTIDAHPGQLLYGAELAREDLDLSLTANAIERIKKHLNIAEERLNEAKILAEKGETETVKEMVNEYQRELEEAKVEVGNAKARNIDIIPALEAFTEATPKYASILGNLVAKDPAMKDEIQPAINASLETYQAAVGELQDITGKAYAEEIAISMPS